jgi:hypothetical protein
VVSLSWSSTSLHHVSLTVPRCGQSLRRCWDLCDGISKAESGTRHTSICASSRDITCLPAALGCLKPSQVHPTTLNVQNLPHDWTNLALPRTKGKRNPLLRSTRIHTRTLALTPIQSVLRIDPIDLTGMTIADIAATDTIPVHVHDLNPVTAQNTLNPQRGTRTRGRSERGVRTRVPRRRIQTSVIAFPPGVWHIELQKTMISLPEKTPGFVKVPREWQLMQVTCCDFRSASASVPFISLLNAFDGLPPRHCCI